MVNGEESKDIIGKNILGFLVVWRTASRSVDGDNDRICCTMGKQIIWETWKIGVKLPKTVGIINNARAKLYHRLMVETVWDYKLEQKPLPDSRVVETIAESWVRKRRKTGVSKAFCNQAQNGARRYLMFLNDIALSTSFLVQKQSLSIHTT